MTTPQPDPLSKSDPRTKTEILAAATNSLTSRVGALADAVQVNNYKIDQFQNALEHRPTKASVDADFAKQRAERSKVLRRVTVTIMLSVLGSSVITYQFANAESKRRCLDNAHISNTLVQTIKDLDPEGHNPILARAIDNLQQDKVAC